MLPKPVEKETLYIKPTTVDGVLTSTVSDKQGKVLFTSLYDAKAGGDTMLVVDYRKGTTKREKISVSNSLTEAAQDMRTLGYITENQVLAWAR